MATTVDFIEFVCEQIQGSGIIRYQKMFGEYMVYVNELPVLLVCDNTVFVKMLPAIEQLMQGSSKGYPYKGAKEHYILDIEDREHAKIVAMSLAQHTAPPKRKK